MKKKAKEEKKKQDSFSTGSGNKPILCVPLCFSEETTLTGEADCGGEWKSQIYKYLPTPMEIETSKQQSCCGVFLLQPLTFLPIENKHLSRWVGSRNRVRQVCELACQEKERLFLLQVARNLGLQKSFFWLPFSAAAPLSSPFWKPVPIAELRGGREFGAGQWGGGGGGGISGASPPEKEEEGRGKEKSLNIHFLLPRSPSACPRRPLCSRL